MLILTTKQNYIVQNQKSNLKCDGQAQNPKKQILLE